MESETLYAETHYGTCELKAILSRLTADTSNTTLKISYNASDNVNWTPPHYDKGLAQHEAASLISQGQTKRETCGCSERQPLSAGAKSGETRHTGSAGSNNLMTART